MKLKTTLSHNLTLKPEEAKLLYDVILRVKCEMVGLSPSHDKFIRDFEVKLARMLTD